MGAAIQPQPFGKYFLLEKIATGGMAEIYKAMYRAGGDFEKTLVIKRILPHLATDQEFVAMFRDEAKLTVRLNHANIVQVFDFSRQGDDHFLAMEYVQGQNLRQVMRRCQELGATVPIPFALYVCMEVCKGLQYAHTRKDDNDEPLGVIHRDITPSNILLSYDGEVKVADFGIAKAASRQGGTQAGMIKGKASYLSPEQVAGKEVVDHRADVFSLGAVLWELLVGRKLFSGDNDFEIMNKISEAEVTPPSKMNASVPSRIDLVAKMALEHDRLKRYPNAASFQKDLSRLLLEFGGSVTTTDIGGFLQRLFKVEIDAEKEASKSMRRLVVDVAKIESAANEGATLVAPEPVDRNTEPNPGGRRLPAPAPPANRALLAAGAALVAIATVVVAVFLGGMIGGGPAVVIPTATPVVVVERTPEPTPAPVDSAVAVIETPVVLATPEQTPVAIRTAKPVASGTPRVVAPTATPSPKATAVAVSGKGMGLLKLDSQPWGEIWIDGKSTGRQTPAFDIKLPIGKHKIRLVNSVAKLEASFEVEILAEGVVKKVVKLEPVR